MRLGKMRINLTHAVLFVVVGILLGCFVIGSCARHPVLNTGNHLAKAGTKLANQCSALLKMALAGRGASNGKEGFGAPLGYNMQTGVPAGAFTAQPNAQQLDTHTGPVLPLPEGQLFFFADNTFSPSCCTPPFSGVSSSDGCACVTKEQVDYINMRGGNRTLPPCGTASIDF